MRSSKVDARPLGGGMDWLAMIVGFLLVSALCTLAANILGR
jgi:hypothetical protein